MMGEEWEEIRKCWEPDSNLHCLQKQAPLLSVSEYINEYGFKYFRQFWIQ